MTDLAVQLRGVRKRYPHFALDDINLDLPDGRVLGLIGPNGAGKSTLLRIVMGLVRADAGDITVLGRAMPAEERSVKARVGFVSEDMALYGAETLDWHMRLVRDLHDGWDEARAVDLLTRFNLTRRQKMRGMSRGQQVKALLLLAMARRADLLVLDEPTTGLDPLVRHELVDLLAASRADRRATIFSSHNGEDVASLADDVAFLYGEIIAHGPVASFLGGGRNLEQAFLEHVGAVAGPEACRNGRAA